MITVLTLLKVKPSPNGEAHGERPFWREFGPQYLEAWIQNVRKYVPQPHEIVVMSDALGLVRPDVRGVPLDKTVDAPGFWAKLEMFRHGEGKTLYCDLDNAINGPLDELCALEPEPLIMLDDRRVPGLPNGSLILFDADRCRHLWDWYASIPVAYHTSYTAHGDDYSSAFDQAYIARNYRPDLTAPQTPRPPLFQDLLPSGYILNARSELPNAPDWQSARVIFGCGSTKPHTATHPGFSLR